LYVVFDCGGAKPRLFRVRDPFAKLIAKTRGNIVISYSDITRSAEAIGSSGETVPG